MHPRHSLLRSPCPCPRPCSARSMFRVADIQKRSVIDPRVRVIMYTWGPGRLTAEGEQIPVVAQVGGWGVGGPAAVLAQNVPATERTGDAALVYQSPSHPRAA